MDRINNYLYYLIVVILIGAAAFFFHSYLLAITAAGFVLLPPVSFILLRLSVKKLSIDLSDNEPLCKRNEDCKLSIAIKNKSLVPVLNYCFKTELVNDFSGQVQSRYINASVPAIGKRIVEINFKPVLCGRINVFINEVRVRDMMSFFEMKREDSARLVINIMPRRIKMATGGQICENVSDESERAKKDSAGTEVIDIREYIRGDGLKTVHWKLSAKKDTLYVREKGDNTLDRTILLFELNREDINGILDIVYAVARHYIRDNQPIKVCWAGRGDEQLISRMLYEEGDIYPMFERIYGSAVSNGIGYALSVAKRQLTGGSILYVESAEKGVSVVNL